MAAPTLFVHKLRAWEIHLIHKEKRRTHDPRYRDHLDAVLLSSEGWAVKRIAKMLGVSYAAVRNWILDFERFGIKGLKVKTSPGAPCKVDADGEACLRKALAMNPRDLGYRFTKWTLSTLAEHLHREVHVRISISALSRTLKRLRYRYKRPKHSMKNLQNPRKVSRIRRERDAILKKPFARQSVPCSSFKTNASSISIPTLAECGV